MSKLALIVDDNDVYTELILFHLEPQGYSFERAYTAQQGLEMARQEGGARYQLIVTDITMEGQTAGLKLIRRLRRLGFTGVLLVASTGFNFPVVLHLAKPLMTLWGVDLLLPKEPLKRGSWRCTPISQRGREFIDHGK